MRSSVVILAAACLACGTPGREFRIPASVVEGRPRPAPKAAQAEAGADVVAKDAPASIAWKLRALGTPEVRKLSNGIDVTVVRRRDFPAATVVFVLDRGTAAAAPGVAELYARALIGDSSEYDAREAHEYLRFVGASTFGRATTDGVFLQVSALSPLLFSALSRATPMFVGPQFDTTTFERVRRIAANERAREEGPQTVAHEALYRRLYPEPHPYAAALGGATVAQIEGLERDALRSFRESFVTTERMHVVAVGEIDADALVRLLEKQLAGVPRKAAATVPAVAAASTSNAGKIFVIDRKGASQSNVAIGFPGAAATKKNRVLPVLAASIGSGLSSRLNLMVRKELGATYGVRAHAYAMREDGVFQITAAIDTTRTAQAFKGMWSELDRMAREPLDADALAAAQRDAADMEDGPMTRSLAWHLAYAAADGLSPADFAARAAQIEAVTAEDVRAAAEKDLARVRATMIVVGDAAKIVGPLRELGLGEVVVVTK